MAGFQTRALRARVRDVVRQMGPGLITGAADDDPSGIATYAQAGAAFGYQLGWTVVLTLPFMIAVQEIAARIGRVTGGGLGSALRRHMPRWVVLLIVGLLLLANVVNLAADIGAMADGARMLAGGSLTLWAVGFAVLCAAAEIWTSYPRYARLLKLLTLALLAYVALLFVVDVPWRTALAGALVPRFDLSRDALTTVVALFGTTISPYLLFWQAAEEAEEEATEPDPRPLRTHPEDGRSQLSRIRFDTVIGMAYSNAVSFSIIIGTAATLHVHGQTNVATAAQAAAALQPIAGRFATVLFAVGLIGTGLLAVPVLAGSCGYALSEAVGWRVGLNRRALEARGFYGTITVATLLGVAIVFSPLDPIKALFWSAVINGAVCAPVILAMVAVASRPAVMGSFVLSNRLRALGVLTALLMAAATAGSLVL